MLVLILLPATAAAITCWQCASTEGKRCPDQAETFSSSKHDACITWRLGNGTILLQNLVTAAEECSDEKVAFWSQFVDLYYSSVGGGVSCCYSDNCNDGSSAVSATTRQRGSTNTVRRPLCTFYFYLIKMLC